MANKYLQMDNRICLERQNKTNEQVTELILDYCQASRVTGLTEEFVNLEALSIINVGLITLEGFPRLPRLRKLELCDNKIVDGLHSLQGCPNLQDLNLSGNSISELCALEPLKDLHALSNLDMFNCEVTKASNYRQKTLDLLPNLQTLDGLDRSQKGILESEDEGVYDGTKMDDEPVVADSDCMDFEESCTRNVNQVETNYTDIDKEQQTVSTKDANSGPESATSVREDSKMREDLSTSETNTLDSSDAILSEQVTVVENTIAKRSDEESVDQRTSEHETESEKQSENEIKHPVDHPQDTPRSPEPDTELSAEKANETPAEVAVSACNETFDKTVDYSSCDAADESLDDDAHKSMNETVDIPSNDSVEEDAHHITTGTDNVNETKVQSESIADCEKEEVSVQAQDSEQNTIANLTPMQASSKISSLQSVEPDSAGDESSIHEREEKVADNSEIQVVNISADQDSDPDSADEANVNSSKGQSFDEGDNMDDEEDEEEEEEEENDEEDDEILDNDEDIGQLDDPYCGYSSITPEEIEEGEYIDDEDDVDEEDEDEMLEDEANDRTVELVESDDEESDDEDTGEKSS